MEKRVLPDRLIYIVLPITTGHVDKCLFRKWIKIDLTEAQAEAIQRVCSGLQQAQAQTRDGRYCNSPELVLQWLLERIEEQMGVQMRSAGDRRSVDQTCPMVTSSPHIHRA